MFYKYKSSPMSLKKVNSTFEPHQKLKDLQDMTVESSSIDSLKERIEQVSPSNKRKRHLYAKETISTEYWPVYFKDLDVIFTSINMVYSIVCLKSAAVLTFDNCVKAILGLTRDKIRLELHHLAELQVLFDALNVQLTDHNDMFPLEIPHVIDTSKESIKDPSIVLEFLQDKMPVLKRHDKLELQVPRVSARTAKNRAQKRIIQFRKNVENYLKANEKPLEALNRDSKRFLLDQTIISNEVIPGNDIESIVIELKTSEWYRGQIVEDACRIIDAQMARYGKLNIELSKEIKSSIYSRNVEKLYIHQAQAINKLIQGTSVVVSTSTASGKSLIYQLPMLLELENDVNSKFIFVFPTKALAQDQKNTINQLLRFHGKFDQVFAECFDGDTPQVERWSIIQNASIILTNPDMLHISILPGHTRWRNFLQNLKILVLDELHIYSGIFGTHVAFIIRRLLRICSALGNNSIKFVSCSATIGDPLEHFKTIIHSEKIHLVDGDGSPSGKKHFVCWNPHLNNNGKPVSCISEAAELLAFLINKGIRTIAFCKVRKICEILLKQTRTIICAQGKKNNVRKVMSYRGGYPAETRRKIEKNMFKGALLGIIATTALELGIDIGSLDAVIVVGFPYHLSNMKQEIGRAGRRAHDSLAIFVADSTPIDQYFLKNPKELFAVPQVRNLINIENTLILESHIQCAAFELPFQPSRDELYFGKQTHQIANTRLLPKDGFFYCDPIYLPNPATQVSIRNTEDGQMIVVDVTDNKFTILDELEPSRTFYTIYEGAIYLNQGLTFLVRHISQDHTIAQVERTNVNWTTRPRDYEIIEPLQAMYVKELGSNYKAFYGSLTMSCCVYGYYKIDSKNKILDAVELDKNIRKYVIYGIWIDIPLKVIQILCKKKHNVSASIHAAEHCLLAMIPNFEDGSASQVPHEFKISEKQSQSVRRSARILLYERKSNATYKVFQYLEALLNKAYTTIKYCECQEDQGCTHCVLTHACPNVNKTGAAVILGFLLGKQINLESVPMGREISQESAIGSLQCVEQEGIAMARSLSFSNSKMPG